MPGMTELASSVAFIWACHVRLVRSLAPYDCSGPYTVETPKTVLVIHDSCFSKCSKPTQVTFESPAAIHTIESGAFSHWSRLASFTVPGSVSTLRSFVFKCCTSLPDHLFYRCRSLTSLTLSSQSGVRPLTNRVSDASFVHIVATCRKSWWSTWEQSFVSSKQL
jgi:hypothetical protein